MKSANEVTNEFLKFPTEGLGICEICSKPLAWKKRLNPLSVHENFKGKEIPENYRFVLLNVEDRESHPECHRQQLQKESSDYQQTLHFQELASRSGIRLEQLSTCRFSSFQVAPENKSFLHAIKNWTFEQDGYFLTGGCGAGKTHLLIALAQEQMSQGRQVLFIESVSFFRELMSCRSHETHEERDRGELLMKKAKEAYILILDDFGSEKFTEAKESALYELINERCIKKNTHKTFITSNLTAKELSSHVHDRIISRVNEMCSIKQLKDIPDYRKRRK